MNLNIPESNDRNINKVRRKYSLENIIHISKRKSSTSINLPPYPTLFFLYSFKPEEVESTFFFPGLNPFFLRKKQGEGKKRRGSTDY